MSGRHARPPSSTPRSGRPLPPDPDRGVVPRDQFDTDEALRNLSRWGWTLIAYGDRAEPELLVAHQRYGDHVDVLIIAAEDRCAGYRAPLWPDQDPIEVGTVVWYYQGDVTDVLRMLLALPTIDRTWPQFPMPPEAPLPGRHTTRRTIRLPQ